MHRRHTWMATAGIDTELWRQMFGKWNVMSK